MKNNVIFLIVGIIMFALGFYQNIQYEEKSLVLDATITSIKTTDDETDGISGYKHTYYGKYTVDGKVYKNKKLDTQYTSDHRPSMSKGDKIEIRVSPDDPDSQTAEGGLFAVVGLVLIVFNAVPLYKNRKKAANATTTAE